MAELILEEAQATTTAFHSITALAKGRSPKKEEDSEDMEEEEEDADAVEGGEEEADDWDPDFEEFDLPKSKKGKDKEVEEEEDFKVEEEDDFKDMDLFNDSASGGFDDDDEDY